MVDMVDKVFVIGLKIFIILFIILAFICSCEAYGNTWTIDDGKFKSVYRDREECIRMNGNKAICDDESQVMYK